MRTGPVPPRVLGVADVAFASFNCVVGGGVFGLPAPLAQVLGPAAFLAYATCTFLVLALGLCLAEAGTRISEPGGAYAYVAAAFGPLMGGIAGTVLLLSNFCGAAAVANLFVDTLGAAVPACTHPLARAALLLGGYTVLALANVRGARQGSLTSIVLAVAKLLPLLLIVGWGAWFVRGSALHVQAWPGAAALGEGSALLFFAFTGFEGGLVLSGEMRDPPRTVPRALLLALLLVAPLYAGLQIVAQGILGGQLGHSASPLIDVSLRLFGPAGASLMVGAILVSAAGMVAADMLLSPRIAYGLAGRGQLPRVLACLHPRFGTPAVAVVAYATGAALLAINGSFRQMAFLSSASTLLLYLLVCLGLLRLRRRGVQQAGQPFRAPGGALLPLLTGVVLVMLLAATPARELLLTLAVAGVAALGFGAQSLLRPSTRPPRSAAG